MTVLLFISSEINFVQDKVGTYFKGIDKVGIYFKGLDEVVVYFEGLVKCCFHFIYNHNVITIHCMHYYRAIICTILLI